MAGLQRWGAKFQLRLVFGVWQVKAGGGVVLSGMPGSMGGGKDGGVDGGGDFLFQFRVSFF